MVKTTRAQREALARVYKRLQTTDSYDPNKGPRTYRQFRKTVQPYFGGDGCILVPFAGMWLGIETDGYTHS